MSRTYSPQTSLLDSNNSIWIIAILLSLAAHAALFFQKNKFYNAEPSMSIQETITHVRFASISPPPVKVIEPEIKKPIPEPILPQPKTPEKIVEKQPPEPPVKPVVIEKKPRPKAKLKKKPTKKTIQQTKKKTTTPKPFIQEKITQVKPSPSLNTKPQINKQVKISPLISQADQRLIEQTRKNYQALLMRHIEAHKYYPRVARKRKIEDKILVTFTLLAHGSIKNLQINGKKSILVKATKNAISHALPMPPPPKEINLPLAIKFNINYFLK